MSKFDLFPSDLKGSVGVLESYTNTLKNCAAQVEEIRKSLDFSGELQEMMDQSLKSIIDKIKRESADCSNLKNSLGNIIQTYQNTESDLGENAKISWRGLSALRGRASENSYNMQV